MTPELQKSYDDAAVPFIDGAITVESTRLKSWRYFVEIGSACNLHCPTCVKGAHPGFEHENGWMDPELMEKILDKIQAENPQAICLIYGNSEPALHPKLPECVASIKRRGLNAQISTNGNFARRVDELLDSGPDMIIISLSGFTQDVYVRGHVGGNIEKVMTNMRAYAEANGRLIQKQGGGPGVDIRVNYHIYDYNRHEVELMREFCNNLGLGFFTSIARAISMENSIQFCRSKDPDATPFEVQEGRQDWNKVMPPVSQTYIDTMVHLNIPPDKAREMYQHFPLSEVCPVGAGSLFTFIRHDGKTQLCACTADRRITLKDYLDTTPDELIVERTGHSVCKQCIKYRLNLYFMIADRDKWETNL